MSLPKRVVLVGPMGAGKSTIGRMLAKELGYRFLDSDRIIEERCGANIPWIFDVEGEDGFLPWAKVIVRFKALQARRTVARDRLVLSEETVALLAEEALELAPDQVGRERKALDNCLQKLSNEHQQLVLLPYREPGGLTELAQRTDRSANSLYKLLGRLREKLRLCVERELVAEGGHP